MREELIERLFDVIRFSNIPMGRLFSEFVEQVGPERLQYIHDEEFIKLIENFYSDL